MKRLVTLALAFAVVLGMAIPASAAAEKSFSVELKDGSTQTVSVYTHPSTAKMVLDLVNTERTKAGLNKVTWEPALAKAAEQRAAELTVLRSHTRPSGKKWSTVSSLAKGENVAGGALYSAKETVDGWMNSKGHRENILEPRFTTMGVAVVEEENGLYHWAQLFGTGTVENTAAPKTPAKVSSSSSYVNQKDILASANTALQKASNDAAKVNTKNATAISSETLGALAKAAGSKNLTLTADTLDSNGKMQARLYLNPKQLTNWQGDYKLGVVNQGSHVDNTRKFFEKWYKNKMVAIYIEQTGDLGASTHIAAKVNLKDFNTDDLVFYTYNAKTNNKSIIKSPNYSIDDAGFLHFYTTVGGDILISEKALTK